MDGLIDEGVRGEWEEGGIDRYGAQARMDGCREDGR